MHPARFPRRAFLGLAGGAAAALGLTHLEQALATGARALPAATPPPAYPNPDPVTGDTRVHDPSLARTPNGTYILTHTGANLSLKTSTDRINWHDAGVVWPNGAPWTTAYTAGSTTLWAPDISFHNGQLLLYYAASTFGSQRSGIFLATSPT